MFVNMYLVAEIIIYFIIKRFNHINNVPHNNMDLFHLKIFKFFKPTYKAFIMRENSIHDKTTNIPLKK